MMIIVKHTYKSIFLLSFLLILFHSCVQNRAIDLNNYHQSEKYAQTYFTIRLDNSSKDLLRANVNENDQSDLSDFVTQKSGKVSSIVFVGYKNYFLWNSLITSANKAIGNADNVFWKDNDYYTQPRLTIPGKQKSALVLNAGSGTFEPNQDLLNGEDIVYGTDGKEGEDLSKASKKSMFLMTSKVKEVDIQPNISKTVCFNAASSESDKNNFKYDCERLVSYVFVHVTNADVNENDETKYNISYPMTKVRDNSGSIYIKDDYTVGDDANVKHAKLTYAVVNTAAKVYLYRNHAGERTMKLSTSDKGQADYGQYENLETWAQQTLSATDATPGYSAYKTASSVQNKLIRLGNLSDLGPYAAKDVYIGKSKPVGSIESSDKLGFFFFENSVDPSTMTTANKTYGFYRLPYVKIYATFVPNYLWWRVKKDGKYVFEKKAFKAAENPGDDATYDYRGMTFYKGAGDGQLYKSLEAAKNSPWAPNQKVYTYTNGRCAYRVLINRVEDDNKLAINANTRRNNAYEIQILHVNAIGMPWDSSDPNDPNLTKPDTKNEGSYPDDPNIDKQKVYINALVKTVAWKTFTREMYLN